ncbi:MAG: mannose-1-phosphate guanylyltransferase/mannose-6-phosphate isomerase [Candidatus Aquirickettsiella sp.]
MLVPVVLSGGNGSRLWPVSREAHPKPFIRLNNDSYSLIQKTYQRAVSIPNVEKIITVTNFEYYYQTKKELKNLGYSTTSKKFSFILEPLSRNTAAAIAFSALFIKKMMGPEAVLLVLPADHIILNQDKFNLNIEKAYQLAKKNLLTTFGIIPHKAETAYGYIQYCKSDAQDSAYKVLNFYEKPRFEDAQFFIEQGNFLWNSGIFCFNVKTILDSIQEYTPELYLKVLDCWKVSTKNNIIVQNKIKLDADRFAKLENISIDYALMEKAQNIIVIPAEFGWSDIGSWDVLNTLLKPEKNNNRIQGNAFLKETYNTNIYSQGSSNRVIAVLGIKNLTIVDTHDALLICKDTHIQKVKQLVEELKLNGHESYRYHQTVYRPWGHYIVLDQGLNYKLKRLIVDPGASLSLQMHQFRSEYWTVVAGKATVENDQKKFILEEFESTYIALGNKHCLSNFNDKALILIELQIGSYLGEDDIIRFKDNYDRENNIAKEEKNICI